MRDLPVDDERSRAIVAQMRADEARHGASALAAGGADFPQPVKDAMTLISGVMTATAYRV
jgi:ubiquinone biosynthesis monooxygenase Coq7